MLFSIIDEKIEGIIKWIEIILAIILVLTVIAEGAYIVIDLLHLVKSHHIIDQSKTVLGDFLVLVVSLEFAIMLIRKNPFAIIDIVMIALARKVVLEYKSATDYFIAAITLALLFLVRKVVTKQEERRRSEKRL
ncbi:phosphate-starvation-inducible PsiE family protein [Tepidibacillus sp. LV47]|uniref:phosphate-starvation-inducible PsiE family protein n=1 Tax=Tepidibacillus sp. LV47 TaxID=3398228 RepID=UPI003AADB565